ncbi:RNA-binding motif, single-stranded-interacting protein 2 [Actinomortierella ambigua]|nr:RNA-binding motif, single-stranded-interacting protein 2 [Actinomortierella ambigua]
MGKRKTKNSASTKKKKLFSVLDGEVAAAHSALAPAGDSATTLASTGKVHLGQGPPAADSHSGHLRHDDVGEGWCQQQEPSMAIAPEMEANRSATASRDTSLLIRSPIQQQFPPPPLIPGKADHRFNVFIKGLELDMDSRALFELFKPSQPTAWSARRDIRPNSTDSSAGTPELSTSSSVSSPHPDYLQDPVVGFSSTPLDRGHQPTSPVLLPPTLRNLEPYSEPLGKTLFGFDSGFFGSRVGMQTLDGTLGINGSTQPVAAATGGGGGINPLHDWRLSSEATTFLRDHNEEALYHGRDSRTLYIQNLELDCNDQKLWHICSEFGTVISAKAIVDPWTGICEGHGFVTFDTELTAVRTLRAMRARGYVANLPDESPDSGQAAQPFLQPSDLYQISNRLDDGGHGPLDVLLTDYLHQLASDTRAQEPLGHPVGFNGSSPGALRNGPSDLQPFFNSHERDEFLEEPLEPVHNSMEPPIIYFSNLRQGIRRRNLFELCASYGPLVLHLHDFETMEEPCLNGRGQVQFVSSQDAWGALEGLLSLQYVVQLGRHHMVTEDPVMLDFGFSNGTAPQWQRLQEGPLAHHATSMEMTCHNLPPLLQQQDHETVDIACSHPSPPTTPLTSAPTATPSSSSLKNGSIKINKVFSFADAVKKAPAELPPTPPPSALNGRAAAAARKPVSPQSFNSVDQNSAAPSSRCSSDEGSTAPPSIREPPPVIRMPIPTDHDEDDYGGSSNVSDGPGLTKMGGVQNKLDKNEYRMNLFVRDLEPAMTDLKLYEICVQFGRVLSCRVVMKHGACAGLGFVMFTTQDGAEKARIGLKKHGYHAHVAGHAATTKLRCKTMSETVFLMNLPTFVKEYHIRELFKHYGIVTCNVLFDPQTGKGRGVGFLKLRDLETAERFIHENHGRLMGKDWKLPLQVLPARR